MGVAAKKRWIFFDLDDTLIPSSLIYETCYKKMKLLDDSIFFQARANVKKNIQKGHTSAHNRLLYFKEYLRLKKRFSPKRVLLLNDRYETLLEREASRYVKKSKRAKLIKQLSNQYNLAVVTNETCRTQMIKMRALDPSSEFFQVILTSEEVGFAKPHPSIFNQLLQITKADAKKSVFVGDDYNNDMVPALEMGMTAVLTKEFTGKAVETSIPSKVRIIDHLSQLEDQISRKILT